MTLARQLLIPPIGGGALDPLKIPGLVAAYDANRPGTLIASGSRLASRTSS